MAEHTPLEIMRHASTWSIVWGILLIIFGMLAVGSPFVSMIISGITRMMLSLSARKAATAMG